MQRASCKVSGFSSRGGGGTWGKLLPGCSYCGQRGPARPRPRVIVSCGCLRVQVFTCDGEEGNPVTSSVPPCCSRVTGYHFLATGEALISSLHAIHP